MGTYDDDDGESIPVAATATTTYAYDETTTCIRMMGAHDQNLQVPPPPPPPPPPLDAVPSPPAPPAPAPPAASKCKGGRKRSLAEVCEYVPNQSQAAYPSYPSYPSYPHFQLHPHPHPHPHPQPPHKRRPITVPHADIVFRLLVSSSKIGRVIGKQGARIRELRETSNAQIKITDPLSKGEDRMIMISSMEGGMADSFTAAEQMLVRIASLVIDEPDESSLTIPNGPMGLIAPQMPSNLIRLVIGRSQAGCLIGKEGSIIKDIRETTGASVRVMPVEQTPFSSCMSESDRLVQISGEIPQVQEAVKLVAKRLKENPPKESITLKPTYHQQLMRYAQAAYPGGGYGLQFSPPMNNLPVANGSVDFQPPAATAAAAISMMPKLTSEVTVPSALMGGIIGRGGVNITHVRSLSGCAVKVHSQEDGKTERRITFEGTAEQVTTAQSLVQAFMNSQ